MDKKILFLSIISLLLLASCASGATINVGPGYTYTTISSGVAAASSGDTVYVHAGTYTLHSPVTLKSGITIHGDGYNNTFVYGPDYTDWQTDSTSALFQATSCSNVNIYGFKFIGSEEDVNDIHTVKGGPSGDDGRETHQAIRLWSCTNVFVHDCYGTLLYSDFIRTSSCNGLYVYNCIINTHGHDGGQLYNSRNILWYNNYVSTVNNCGVRFSQCSGGNLTCYRNTFTNGLSNSGWAGVQVQGSTKDLYIAKNVFTRMTDNTNIIGYSFSGSNITATNNIGYSCPSTFVSSISGATTSNNSIYTTEYNWAAMGYGFDASLVEVSVGSGDPTSTTGNYSGTPALTLTSPTNNSSVNPKNGLVSFAWSNVGSNNYTVQVSLENTGNNLTYNRETTSTSASLAVANNTTYYWRARAYINTNNTWGEFTDWRTVHTLESERVQSGVFGIVYTSNQREPVPGAVVTIMNDSWSSDYVTGNDGYYQFNIISNSGTYYISATAEGYDSPQYQLPINSSDYVERDIALTKSDSYFAPHQVTFIVTDQYLMHRYSNIQVGVIAADSVDSTLLYNESTGDDGGVTYELDENTRYKIITSMEGRTQIDYVVPGQSKYYIIWNGGEVSLVGEQFYDNISMTVTKNEENATSAYINATYLDNSTRTNSVTYVLGYVEANGTFTELNNSSAVLGSASNYSFVVNDYLGKEYLVKLIIDHNDFGTVTKAFAILFGGNTTPFRDYKEFSYLAIFILFIVATQFGKLEHASGAILLCGLAWFFWYIGAFLPLGETANNTIFACTTAATVYAIIAYFNTTRGEI